MELSQLTAYAEEKYNITEQHKWQHFPGFSVLCDPATDKWAALLMRQWDGNSGEMMERCDIKCGGNILLQMRKPYLSLPYRMKGESWVGVKMDETTEESVVFRLFDRAMTASQRHGATIVLASELPKQRGGYAETALPVRAAVPSGQSVAIPKKIQEMTALYEYGDGSFRQKCKNFYTQARFMADYEDNYPWYGEVHRYFPTYHDLRLAELRGYFTWRAALRRGDFQPTATSLSYIYIYELLNGAGTDSPEDVLRKLKAFETGYLDSGIGDAAIRANLHRWMKEFSVIHAIAPDVVSQYLDDKDAERDKALAVLKQAEQYSDSEVFEALCAIATVRLQKSPVIAKHGGEGVHLFAALWRHMLKACTLDGKDFFTACFGAETELRYYPLTNAVYYQPEPCADTAYIVSDVRRYTCRDGIWREVLYPILNFKKERLNGFAREADRLLRLYLKTGRPLQPRDAESWATPYLTAAIHADRQAKIEAAKPKINIEFSQLDQIRRDASTTRDSLLTEEELFDEEETIEEPEADDFTSDLLTDEQNQIIQRLLLHQPIALILKERRLMPTIVADEINEALFDEIGDTVLECDGDSLILIEDYIDELKELLGGSHD